MFIKKLNKDFFKNILKVFSGTSISQIFPMIGYLFIMQLYSAENFGIYAVWLGIVLLVSMLGTLKLEQIFAIEFIKHPESNAFSYVNIISFTLSLVISLIVCFALFLAEYEYISLSFFIYLLIASILSSLLRMYECYFVAISQFNTLIKLRMINNFLVPFFQVTFGFLGASFEMLIFGYILGSLLAVIFSIFSVELKFFKIFTLQELKFFLYSYRDIPTLKLPADFTNNLAQQAPTFLVSYRFGEEYAGFLALTLKFLGAPLAIVGRAISDVFRPLIIKSIEQKGNCINEFLEASFYLFITSIIIFITVFPFGENIFLLFFGEDWVISGTFSSILSIFFAFRIMASPVSYILTAFRKVGVELIIQLILLGLVVISFIVSKDIDQSIIFFTIFGSAGYLLYYFVSFIYSYGILLNKK